MLQSLWFMFCDFFLICQTPILLFSKRCITNEWIVRENFPIKERHVILDKNDLIWKRNIDGELKAKVIKSAIWEKCLRLRQETGPEGRGPPDFCRSVSPIQTRGTDYIHHIPICPQPPTALSRQETEPGYFSTVVNNVSMTGPVGTI